MIKFLIKKSFWDGWDNLIQSFVYNIACMAIVALYLIVVTNFGQASMIDFFIITAVFLLLFTVFNFGLAGLTVQWSKYSPSWGQGFFSAIKDNIANIVLFYILAVLSFFCVTVLIPFYLNSMTFMGLFISFMEIWVLVVLFMAMQYYIPLCLTLKSKKPFFILKQCFILALDNKLFTLFVSIKTIFDFLLSALSFFFIPGLSFISLSHMDAVKLLHLRYRYMDEHHTEKKDVNLYEMLKEEEENIGDRTFRMMFRPWRDQK